MKASDVPEKVILATHCDWIIQQMQEIKALLKLKDNDISTNKNRAISDIDTSLNSINELKLHFETGLE